MSVETVGSATLDDLYRVEGKAELIAGRIVHFVASGFDPSRVTHLISFELELYSRLHKAGYAFGDGLGYALHPSLSNGRQSFSPDASFYFGPRPTRGMRFLDGIPIFAVEVRSENDYGPAAEVEMEAKRADYFEAGTLIVWDVDFEAKTVASYRGDPSTPIAVYQADEVATAELALPGWQVLVAELFQ